MDFSASAQVEPQHLNCPIQLYAPSQSPLAIEFITAAFTQRDQALVEFRLALQVDVKLYQTIDRHALFNLQPAVRTPVNHGSFRDDRPIHIQISLKPECLSLLLEEVSTTEAALDYLVKLSQEQERRGVGEAGEEAGGENSEIHPLLLTESWFALSVVQQLEPDQTIGYRTFWSYVAPEALAAAVPDQEKITTGISQFFSELVDAELSPIAQAFASDTIDTLSDVLKELAAVELDEPASTQSIFDAMLNFFIEDDWSFLQIQGETALRLAFAGKNGQWNCYANARNAQRQLVFYSICPIVAPEDKRQPIAEFLTRANYGMIIGNFELDFDDGEIRYKTSIDIEGDTLSSVLIRQLVYTNVTIMDKYLPGIKAILNKHRSPVEAIRAIEQADVDNPVNS